MSNSRHIVGLAAVAVLALAVLAGSAQAGLTGQLGYLDATKDYGFGAGINPATGSPWVLGDVYQLIYVTSTQRDATSTDIFDYNIFVQADADANGIGATAGVTWFVLGSTSTVNARDNAVVKGPVFGAYGSTYTAKDYADFWDLLFPSSNLVGTLAGVNKNANFGTRAGGVAAHPLGDADGTVRLEWSGWQNWSAAWKTRSTTELAELFVLSEPLRVVAEVAHWDLNGATEGAGGATPAGTWDAANTYWNPLADGTGDANAWSAGFTATFGAGGDATGTYTATVDGTQDICGLTFEEGTVTLAPGTDGVLRMVFSSTVDVAAGLTATVATPITQDDPNSRSLVKRGQGTLVLSGANTYTGTTIVNEGTLVLSGSPTGQSNTTVNGGGTLKLDYSADDTGKIHDLAVLTLGGGTVELAGGSHSEDVASTTVAPGLSNVTRSSGSATLVMNAITPGPGMVDFAAAGIATTDTLNTNGILGPWATVGNADWAQNSTDANDAPVTAYTGYTDIAATGDTITDGPATNVRLNSEGAGGNLALSADTTAVNTLLQNAATAATVETAAKTLRTGGIMIGIGQEALTIGAAAGDGTLTTDTAGGVLYLNNANAAKTLTVNALIADNTSASALATAGNVLLQGVNTFTGATYVNAGTLEIGGAGQLAGGTYSAGITIARGATFKYNSSANQILSGSIGGAGGLIKDAAGTLTLSGASTYTGATTISGGTLQIGNGGTTGSLSPDSAITNNATLVFNRSNVATQGVDFAEGISGSGDVTQAGAGILVLAGTNAYTGMTIVSSGALVPNSTSSLPGYDSAGRVVFDGGMVRILVGGTGWTTAEVDTLLANATRTSGALGIDTFHGDLTQWTTFTPANLGALNLSKLGLNTLTLDQANTHAGGTTLIAGQLNINAQGTDNTNSAIGTGTLTINGGTIDANSGPIDLSGTTNNAVTIGGSFAFAGTNALNLGAGAVSITGSRTITLNGDNPLTLGAATNTANAATTLTVNNGTGTGGSTALILGSYALTGGDNTAARTTTINGSGSVTIQGEVSNGQAYNNNLTKAGAGTLILLGANTYSGTTTVSAGVLRLAGSNSGGGGTTVSGSGTLQVASDTALASGTLALNGGAIEAYGAPRSLANTVTWGGNFGFAGSQDLNLTSTVSVTTGGRTITVSNTGNTTIDTPLTVSGNNTFNFSDGSGNVELTGNLTLTGNRTVTVNATGTAGVLLVSGAVMQDASVRALTKAGTGTMILAGENTYTGNTTVSAGMLVLEDDASLKFVIGASGVSNKITGTGVVALGGDFNFDLAGAGTTLGNQWQIVDVGTLAASFESTFSVTSTLGAFTADPGGDKWTMLIPSTTNAYEFTESTGNLEVVLGIMPGDTNGDNVVDAADFITLKQNFGGGVGGDHTVGNFDGVGTVDWADLNILTTNFGAGGAAPATAPEPGSAMLVVLGAAALLRRRRRSCL